MVRAKLRARLKTSNTDARKSMRNKHRRYLKRMPERIAMIRKNADDDSEYWIQIIEEKAAVIMTARLLKQWPYDE